MLWVRFPDGDRFTVRINDASGQTHQIVLKTEPSPDWQRVVLPLARFFARRGEADAVTSPAFAAAPGRWQISLARNWDNRISEFDDRLPICE